MTLPVSCAGRDGVHVDKDAVKVASPDSVNATIEGRVTAALTAIETRIGKIEATLNNTTTTTATNTAGGNIEVESTVAELLAKELGRREWISLLKMALGCAACVMIAVPMGGWWYEKRRRPARLARERQSTADVSSDCS
jgi:hypothetical protein